MPYYKSLQPKENILKLGKTIEIKIGVEPTFFTQENLHILFPEHIQKVEKPDFKYWANGLKNPKFFITGITGTGKTFLAEKISKQFNIEYYNYDVHWDYKIDSYHNKKYVENFLKKLPKSFVIDAVPLSFQYFDFQNYRSSIENVIVICVFKSNILKWIKNIISKPYYTTKNIACLKNNYYKDWIYFYEYIIYLIKPMFFYDNISKKMFLPEEFMEIKKNLIEQVSKLKGKKQYLLKDYIDTLNYDKYYQDIECIDFLGYSESYKTWDNIKNLINWKDKTVIDLGCFHGYFSFKVEQQNAKKVIGLDSAEQILETTKIISKTMNSQVEFLKWSAGEETPNADVALVLNVLHHSKDEEKTLKNINTKTAIFEVNENQVPLIEKYFTITKNTDSHKIVNGKNRKILLGEKK